MPTKKELMNSQKITSQEALVKALLSKEAITIKRPIPAGKTMMSTLDKDDLRSATYNWLRGCSSFTEVTISLAKDPSKFNPTLTRVHTFNKGSRPEWETYIDGRKDLAKKFAEILATQKVLFIKATSEGIFTGVDTTGKFNNMINLTKSLKESDEAYKDLEVGTKVPSPDWEPFIEFIPTKRPSYTNFPRVI